MKEIKAIIRPECLDAVCEALLQIEDLPGMTISKVMGWGKARARSAASPVPVGAHAFARKTQVELVVPSAMAEAVVQAIAGAARTDCYGDGKIFVIDVVDAVKIRTGQRGPGAL